MKMKKIYVAPEMEVMELNIETLMLSMSAPGGDGGDGGPSWGGSASDKEADANGRRGEWGNLWTQN